MATALTSSFARTLHADEPAADRREQLQLYGFLIGRWQTDVMTYEDNGTRHAGTGEIHAGWVLEGRAIQDIWMIPDRSRAKRDGSVLPVAGNWFGTTLRVYDPGRDLWHILWIDPATQNYMRQIGRARGADIVQEGRSDSGIPLRWSFTEITPDSFRWRGEYSADDGHAWKLQVEVFARRVPE